jgi:multiple sugar transport system substrate-binding protein
MKKLLVYSLAVILALLIFMETSFAEKITIEYITLGDVQMDIMDEMVSQFEKENPGIEVKVESWPFGEAYNKYVTRIRAGDPPDCGYMFVTNLSEFNERGAIVPLDDYISATFKQDFYEVLLEPLTLEDGKLYAIPAWFSTRLFMYRKDILDEKGIGIPETPEDLLNMAASLHNPPEMYGFAFPGGSARHIFRWFGIQLWGRGGNYFTPDMKKVTFNDEAGVEALTFLNDLKEYFQPGYLSENEHEVERLFYSGKTPVTQMYYRVLTGSMEENPDWEVVADFAPVDDTVTLGIMDAFSLFKTTPEKQEAAWKWLEFIHRNEYRIQSNMLLGFNPVKKSTAFDFAQRDFIETYPEVQKFFDATPYARFEPIHPLWSQMEDIIGRKIQEVFLGDLEPKEALDLAAEECNNLLDNM